MTDYIEVTIPGEGTASETFAWIPNAVLAVENRYEGVKKNFDNGASISFPTVGKNRRIWKLTFDYRTETERDAILAFIESRIGAEEAFYWIPPDATVAIKVCSGDPVASKIAPDVYIITVEFEEVF